jgi:proteasome lid subunit RPN8/RPN11
MSDQTSSDQPANRRVRVFLEDHTGNKRREAKVASGARISDLIPALVTALGLPMTDPAGQPVTYHLAFNERQLSDEETLESARVEDGAGLTLVPEMTAGAMVADHLSTAAWSGRPNDLVRLGRTWRQRERPWKGDAFAEVSNLTYVLQPLAENHIRRHAATSPHHEVGGLLLGRVYRRNDSYRVEVIDAIPAHHTRSSEVSLTFTGQTWLDLAATRQRSSKEMFTVGWYHSHPGIGVFLSEHDRFVHRQFFGDMPWYLALVLDPSSGEMAVFAIENDAVFQVTDVSNSVSR